MIDIGNSVIWMEQDWVGVRDFHGVVVNLFALGSLRFAVVLLRIPYVGSQFRVIEENSAELASSSFASPEDEQRDASDK